MNQTTLSVPRASSANPSTPSSPKEPNDLEAIKERFELAAIGASVGIWDWIDVKHEDEYWTPKFFQLLGYEDREIRPSLSQFKALLHPDDWAHTFKVLEDHFQNNAPFDVEYRLKHKSGEYRWFRGCGYASRDTEGNPVRMVGSIQDIHDQKTYEAELETLVAQLKQSNNDLERFAYVASHDLQEPLRVISSYVQLLNKRYSDKLGDGAKEFFGFIVDGCKRMQQLINDLLDFSRVGQQTLEKETVNLTDIMKQIERQVATAIDSSAAIVTYRNLPHIYANRSLLIRLLQNLLNNSLKYRAPQRVPNIKISAVEKASAWEISIKDNGIGIEAQYYDRIFIIFQRLHTVDEYSGTGVGLAICQRIVLSQGGNIWVDSTPGEGSTFTFSLPKPNIDD